MKHTAIITRVDQEAPNIVTLYFTVNGATLPFTAGQYITVYFDETAVKTGKAYSLSSAPGDDELSITVKRIGEFSERLCALKPGDTLTVSSPYGFFNVQDDSPIVGIAAGVGIAPIWSIIRDELAQAQMRSVELFLTAPTTNELVFRHRIDDLFASHLNAAATYFVTRESACAPELQTRRFVVKNDISIMLLARAQFYVCGAQAFVHDMWRQLMEAGVDEQRIVTETFFETTL